MRDVQVFAVVMIERELQPKHCYAGAAVGAVEPSSSYEMLRSLLEGLESAHLGCTVVVTHPDGRFVRIYANQAMANAFGVSLETMQSLDVLTMFTAEQRARIQALREAVSAGAPAPPTVTTSIVRSDGTEVPVEMGLGHATIGELRVTMVFMRDLSASVQMEDALRESEERFRTLADASPDLITVSVGAQYVYANRRALAHLGLSSTAQLETFDPWSTVAPERRDAILEQVARLERGENISPILHRVTGPSGNEMVLESSLSFMKFGGRSALVSATRDITDRMQLQAELMKRDRLAAVGLLAAGVAHEINNPLTAVTLQARSLMARGDLPADARASLAQIDEAASRMSAIIGDLLFMARPVEQPQAHVDVAAIVSSTLSLLRAGRGNLPIITMALSDVPPIRGWASKLAQVFFNVIRNSLQAVEGKSDGEIRIHGGAVEERSRVEITISDNGPGIPREVLPRIAQPFFTTRPDGTGLGLWMSQSIMALHGGSLAVHGAPGEGTSVTLVLPS